VGASWEAAFQDFDKRHPNYRFDSSKPQADGAVVHRISELPAAYADEIIAHLRPSSPMSFTDYRVQRTESGKAYLVIPAKTE